MTQPSHDDVTRARLIPPVPVAVAPMAGGPSTPELVAAVVGAGGGGFLAGGMRTAAQVREQVDAARRQVDYHLARTRASAAVRATGLSTPVLEPLQGLLRTMRRLHAERQILAAIDLQDIARLYDGGTTPNGNPYLVMEYVEGTPINEYCAQHDLGLLL